MSIRFADFVKACLSLVAIAIAVGTSVVPTQAFGQQKVTEPKEKLDVEVEVWQVSEVLLKDLQSDYTDSGTSGQMFRLSLTALASNVVKSSKEPHPQVELPAHSLLKITDDGTRRQQIELEKSVILELELRTATVEDRVATLDYAMNVRKEQQEQKVSNKLKLSLGDVAMQQIKFNSADGTEKNGIVFLIPKLRNAEGVEIIDPMMKLTFVGVGFVPRVGRFELKVAEGWTGALWANSMDSPMIRMVGSTNIGKRAGLKDHDGHVRLEAFRADRPVLEVVGADDGFIEVVARRPGIATLRTTVQGVDGKSGNCEVQIVVEPDMTELKQAIKRVLPDASIIVTSIKDSAVLTGTVATSDEHRVLLEVAERYFPETISRVTVTADRTKEPDRTQQNPLRNRRRESADLKELLDEVKSLRDDVRRLSEQVEKLSATPVP